MISSAKRGFRILARVAQVSFIVSWLASTYFFFLPDATNNPRPDLGRTHCLNNHGTLVCLTDREWHVHIGLMIGAFGLFGLGAVFEYAGGNKEMFRLNQSKQHWWVHDPGLHRRRGWKTRPF